MTLVRLADGPDASAEQPSPLRTEETHPAQSPWEHWNETGTVSPKNLQLRLLS
jgi:hypothetical protein